MNVRLLRIDASERSITQGDGSFDVRVLVDLDGEQSWQTLRACPRVLAGFNTTLLSASEALQDLFQQDQVTLHRICKLVGEELRGRSVRVPQLIAA